MSKNQTFTTTYITEVELTEQLLKDNYEFRRNVLSNKLEVRDVGKGESPFRVCTNEAVNSIIIKVRKELEGEVMNPHTLVGELLHSEAIPEYDPIKDYLKSLPEWDKKDRITSHFSRIPGIGEEQMEWCHRWLLSAVAHWLKMDQLHGNECVMMLIGEQGCGKSTFWQCLLPPHLREYYLDHLNLANKNDKEMALTNNLIVNLDEFDKFKCGQQANLKQTLSKVKVNGRPIYGREQRIRDRYASFVATTNNDHPLQDPTGSRRYLVIQIPSGEYIDNETEIDYDQLYAQVLYELQEEKRRYYFNNEEVQTIQLYNSQFQRELNLDDIIDGCLRLPKKGERIVPMSITEIIDILKAQYPSIGDTQSVKIRLGRCLVQHGFVSKTRNTGSVYFAVPLEAA